MFKLDHWNDPRKKIAYGAHHGELNNDMFYTLSGMRNVLEILIALSMRPEDMLSSNFAALEYGCGTGRLLRPFSFLCNSIDGFDPNSECIVVAREETALTKLTINQSKISFYDKFSDIANNKYDFVYSSDVLEHLDLPTKNEMIVNCASVLKDGGIMVHRGLYRGFVGIADGVKSESNICVWKREGTELVLVSDTYCGLY